MKLADIDYLKNLQRQAQDEYVLNELNNTIDMHARGSRTRITFFLRLSPTAYPRRSGQNELNM